MAKRQKSPKTLEELIQLWQRDPLEFFSSQCYVQAEWKGQFDFRPATLTEYQKRAVSNIFGPKSDGVHRVLLSWPKKAGKSWFGAMSALYFACTRFNTKVILASTSMQLCHENIVKQILRCLEHNQWLVQLMGIKDDAFERSRMITVAATGTQIIPWASADSGAAGIDWGLCVVDELALFTKNRHRRFYAELTAPSPARKDPLIIVCSYAGWKEESHDLYELWKEALDVWTARGGQMRDGFIEVRSGDLYASIIQGEQGVIQHVPWYDKRKLDEARKRLPQDFKRMYLNLWLGGSSASYMFTHGQVAACMDSGLGPLEQRSPDIVGPVIVSVDYAAKWDTCVVTAVGLRKSFHMGKKAIIPHVLEMFARCGADPYGGKPENVPLEWVTQCVLELNRRFAPIEIVCDAWYLEGECQRWESLGLKVHRYDVRAPLKHALAAVLWNFVAQGKIKFYPRCGVEVDPDTGEPIERAGRIWDLETELRNIVTKSVGNGITFGHVGEKDSPRRGYDDRAFTVALALHHIVENFSQNLAMPEVDIQSFIGRMKDARSESGRIFAPVVYNEGVGIDVRMPSVPGYGVSAAEQITSMLGLPVDRSGSEDAYLKRLRERWERIA